MQPEDQTSQLYVEVRFKNSRKEFYKNSENLSLHIGDVVSTQSKSGHDVGIVSLTGPLVGVQMKKKGIEKEKEELQKIYRKASSKDVSVWQSSRDKEKEIQKRAREINPQFSNAVGIEWCKGGCYEDWPCEMGHK